MPYSYLANFLITLNFPKTAYVRGIPFRDATLHTTVQMHLKSLLLPLISHVIHFCITPRRICTRSSETKQKFWMRMEKKNIGEKKIHKSERKTENTVAASTHKEAVLCARWEAAKSDTAPKGYNHSEQHPEQHPWRQPVYSLRLHFLEKWERKETKPKAESGTVVLRTVGEVGERGTTTPCCAALWSDSWGSVLWVELMSHCLRLWILVCSRVGFS